MFVAAGFEFGEERVNENAGAGLIGVERLGFSLKTIET